MADTIVTNSPGTTDSGAGWVVALIILVAVIVGGVVMYQRGFFVGQGPVDTTNINVTMPIPTTGGTGGTPK